MAYHEALANNIRTALAHHTGITEKNMFGGLSFLLHGKMCCGVLKDILVVRINPEDAPTLLAKPHVRPMDFTGRPMKGFLYVGAEGYKTKKQLTFWVERSISFVTSLTKTPRTTKK